MAVIKELIKTEADGTISFGNYTLPAKQKVDEFDHHGDLYKVKTFSEITKLEKNGMFLYESVPGTCVEHFRAEEDEISFSVTGTKDAQCTLGMEAETEYMIFIGDVNVGTVTTNLSGKLSISVELSEEEPVEVSAVRK